MFDRNTIILPYQPCHSIKEGNREEEGDHCKKQALGDIIDNLVKSQLICDEHRLEERGKIEQHEHRLEQHEKIIGILGQEICGITEKLIEQKRLLNKIYRIVYSLDWSKIMSELSLLRDQLVKTHEIMERAVGVINNQKERIKNFEDAEMELAEETGKNADKLLETIAGAAGVEGEVMSVPVMVGPTVNPAVTAVVK